MKRTIITVGSLTYAIKLRKILLKEKIASRLIKLDNTSGNLGCTHGIEIDGGDLYATVMIMKKHGFDYKINEINTNDLL